MDYDFYYRFLQEEEVEVEDRDLELFREDDELADLLFELKIDADDVMYRLRVTEEISPHGTGLSDYEVKLAEKRSRGDGHYWRAYAEEEYQDSSETVFKRRLESFIEEEIGLELDEEQETF